MTKTSQAIERKVAYLQMAIKGWYQNAEMYYGVDGDIETIVSDADNDTITVTVIEDGEELITMLSYVSDYSADELYSIWQEYPGQ